MRALESAFIFFSLNLSVIPRAYADCAHFFANFDSAPAPAHRLAQAGAAVAVLSLPVSVGQSQELKAPLPGDENDLRTLMEILRPKIHPLERDAVVFRYESRGDKPDSTEALRKHETAWSKRFFDPEVVRGDDVGPGLFVATDPNATATWGIDSPRLAALVLKQNSKVLSADIDSLPPAVREKISKLLLKLNCKYAEGDLSGYAELIRAFRNSPEPSCRKILIRAFTELGVQEILYPFNTVALSACRMTGTAINIVDPSAIDFDRSNFYAEGVKVEGDPKLTPLVGSLFHEGLNNFFAQSLMHDTGAWKKYKDGFGFFRGAPAADYTAWRDSHILKCGAPQAVEDSSPLSALYLFQSEHADKELQELWLQTFLMYRTRIASESNAVSDLSQLKALRPYLGLSVALNTASIPANWRELLGAAVKKGSPEEQRKPQFLFHAFSEIGLSGPQLREVYNRWVLSEGIAPLMGSTPVPDLSLSEESEFSKSRELFQSILKRCLKIYSDPNLSSQQIDQGECGMQE